jgi:lipopolysaccharide export system permease protein
MYCYTRYIVKTLSIPALLILCTLTSIIWLTQALRFIDLIVNRGLDFSTFFYLSLLLIPSLAIVVLPVSLFSAVILVYNKLIMDSELIVLKGAGLSKFDLAKPALIVALGATFIGYFMSLYLLPASYREFKDMQAFIRNNYASLLLQEGVFSSPVEGLTVYIQERQEDGMLKGILVHDGRIPDKPVTMMAQQGALVQTSNGPRFDLINGNRSFRNSFKRKSSY